MHTEHITFRASPVLAAALYAHARDAGYSVSEYLRAIARERVGLNDQPPPSFQDPPRVANAPDAFCLVRDAGAGDIEAQRTLAERALALASDPTTDCDPQTLLIEGAVFARMAAARGGLGDQEMCIAIAAKLAELDGGHLCDDLLAEAFARIELMADTGSEDAATFLATYSEFADPTVLRLAKDFHARLFNQEEIAR